MRPHTTQARPEISVVLATCSRAEVLAQALGSLLPQIEELGGELVVVDDGSTDSTAELLAGLQGSSGVPITIVSGERRGVAAARNLAASHARGKWLASFDDDQIALPDWLRSLMATAQESGAAAVGGSLVLHLPAGRNVDEFGPRTRGILGEHVLSAQAGPYPRGVRPATNNVLLRRDVFVELGGYDTSFTEGAEDADFFDRVAGAGHAVWFQPTAQALHLIPASRLEAGNLRWTSLRVGAGDARLQQRKKALLGPMKLALLRVAVTLFRDLPTLGWASMTGDGCMKLDVQCSLWYTEGLLRALPGILSSRAGDPFLRSLNFRTRNGERTPPG